MRAPRIARSARRFRLSAIAAGALSIAVGGCGGAGASVGQAKVAAPSGEAGAPAAPPGASSGSTSSTPNPPSTPGASASAGAAGRVAVPSAGTGDGAAPDAGPAAASGAAGDGPPPAAGSGGEGAAAPRAGAELRCAPREFTPGGERRLRMHHVHFNTQDPEANLAFVEQYFAAEPIDFCTDEAGARTTRAAKTERAYFLYTKTAAPPTDMRLNRLAHIGYNHPDVPAELDRLLALDAPLADASVCETAAQGTPCNTFNVLWFYIETPEGARFEVATGPGPSTLGFAHIHLVAPTYDFFVDVLGEALQDPNGTPHVDGVNMVSSGRTGVLDTSITYQDTRGAAVDHIGFSTTDLEAELARIEAAGVKIEEPISFKPEYGFRSFMVRSPEGVWLEILEDAPFAP